MNFRRQKFARGLFVFSIVTYVFSLGLPVFMFAHHDPAMGGVVLAWGWFGALFLEPGWFANPAYAVAVLAFMSKRIMRSVYASVAALSLGLTSFHAKEWYFNEGSGTPIIGLGPGFYVWILSFILLFASCFIVPKPHSPSVCDGRTTDPG